MSYTQGDVVQGEDARRVLIGGGVLQTVAGRSGRRWSRRFGMERQDVNGFWTTMHLDIKEFPPSESICYEIVKTPQMSIPIREIEIEDIMPEEVERLKEMSEEQNRKLKETLEGADQDMWGDRPSSSCELGVEMSEEEAQRLLRVFSQCFNISSPVYEIGPEDVERLKEMSDEMPDEEPETTEAQPLTDLASRAKSNSKDEEEGDNDGTNSSPNYRVEVITGDYEGDLEVGPGATLVYPGLDRILHVDAGGTLHSIAPGDTIPHWLFVRLLDVDNLYVDVHAQLPHSGSLIFDGLGLIECEGEPSLFSDAEEKEALANVGDAWIRMMLEWADMGTAKDILCPEEESGEESESQKQGISPIESELQDLREGALKEVEDLNHIVDRTHEEIHAAMECISRCQRNTDTATALEVLHRIDRRIDNHR